MAATPGIGGQPRASPGFGASVVMMVPRRHLAGPLTPGVLGRKRRVLPRCNSRHRPAPRPVPRQPWPRPGPASHCADPGRLFTGRPRSPRSPGGRHPPRREHAGCIGVDQYRHHHRRIVRPVERRQVKAADQIPDQVCKMFLGQPLAHVRRQQHGRVVVVFPETVRHQSDLPDISRPFNHTGGPGWNPRTGSPGKNPLLSEIFCGAGS